MSSSLILASESSSRQAILHQAGLDFEALPARIDEASVKEAMLADGAPPRDIADVLAGLKAGKISNKRPEAFVLGADQVLVCDDRMYDKPANIAAAADQLKELRGRSHILLSAAVIYHQAEPIWRHVGQATLTMRQFTDAFLADYLEKEGESLKTTVGCYRLEDRGAQLFSRVEGDYFTILGLPLLEVLAFLRLRGLCQE